MTTRYFEQKGAIQIKMGDEAALRKIYGYFESEFPEAERKSFEHLIQCLRKGHYHLMIAMVRTMPRGEQEEMIGYALVYYARESQMLWLDYLAILPSFQSLGYGTAFYRAVVTKSAEFECHKVKGVFVEVEKPEPKGSDFLNQCRRVRFYEKLGARLVSDRYQLPTMSGGFEMSLYYIPRFNEGEMPDVKTTLQTVRSAYDYIHSDISCRHHLFESFAVGFEGSDVTTKRFLP